jgi:hypothetical protein
VHSDPPKELGILRYSYLTPLFVRFGVPSIAYIFLPLFRRRRALGRGVARVKVGAEPVVTENSCAALGYSLLRGAPHPACGIANC